MLRIISGKWKGIKIDEVDRDRTRPTTDKNKEMLFNILGQYFSGGMVLDLFAGSGSLGLEAISRGMEIGYFVDSSTRAIQTIRKNWERVRPDDANQIFLIQKDAISFLASANPIQFDLILIDPPYHFPEHEKILQLITQNHWLHPEGTIVIESGKAETMPLCFGSLSLIREKITGITKFNIYQYEEETS